MTGHAETKPRASNETPEGRAKNRRVEIAIIRGGELDKIRQMSIVGNSASEPIKIDANTNAIEPDQLLSAPAATTENEGKEQ